MSWRPPEAGPEAGAEAGPEAGPAAGDAAAAGVRAALAAAPGAAGVRAALAAAVGAGGVSAAAAAAVEAALGAHERAAEAAAAPGAPERAASGWERLAPPPEADPGLVRLPPSVRLALGVSMFASVAGAFRTLRARPGGLPSGERLWLGGFSCGDMYHSGVSKAELGLTRRMLLGAEGRPCLPLGELAAYYGFARAELCQTLGVGEPSPSGVLGAEARDCVLALFRTGQPACSYGHAGMDCAFWQEQGVSLQLMTALPFGVVDAAAELRLDFALAARMGLCAELCRQRGWGYGDVRAALSPTPAQLASCGLELRNILVMPAHPR
jgi:hypothetical protein